MKHSILSVNFWIKILKYNLIFRVFIKNQIANQIIKILKAFRMISIINGELLRRMSDSLILPFNLNTYAKELKKEYESFELEYKKDLDNLRISLVELKSSISNFTHVAENFHKRLDLIDRNK